MYRRTGRPGLAACFIRINAHIERLMPLLTPTGVLLGLIFYRELESLRFLVPWLFGIMTLSGALKLRAADLGRSILDPRPVLLFMIFSHVLMPAAAYYFSRFLAPGKPDIWTGFLLLFATPTAVSGFIWVSIFKGNGALSLTLILLDTLLAPLIVPASIALLAGAEVELNAGSMMLSLAGMIVLPTILGIVLHELSRGSIPKRAAPYLGLPSKLCLFAVVAINSAAVAPQLNLKDPAILSIAAQGLVLGLLGFGLGRLAALLGRQSRENTVTLSFAVGLRNISAAATLAIAFFPEEAALPAILGMVFQQSLASVAGKFFLQKGKDTQIIQ